MGDGVQNVTFGVFRRADGSTDPGTTLFQICGCEGGTPPSPRLFISRVEAASR